jgi:hypothetical protein
MKKQHLKSKLHSLYGDNSKHSVYQNIPEFVKNELDYAEEINEDWRGDTARYHLLINHINFQNKVVGDFGANTGFFSLSLAYEHHDANFIAYEVNPNHVDFMRSIKRYFGLDNFSVEEKNLNLSGIEDIIQHDILLNFNVLHHAGIDFDKDLVNDICDFHSYAEKYLAKLKAKTGFMVFQMGYNWGGNKQKPIVSPDKMVEFVIYLQGLCFAAGWSIDSMFLHNPNLKKYEAFRIYNNLHESESIAHADSVLKDIDFTRNSEFYKRPILLLRKG